MYTAPLGDHKSAIPLIARWFETEWPSWYGTEGPGDAVEDLLCWCDEATVPVARVVLDENKSIIGIAALKQTGLGEEYGFGPFLSAMYVCPDARRLGAGMLLAEAITDVARRHKFPNLYATTDGAHKLLIRLGWSETGFRSVSDRGPLSILYKDLRGIG